MFTTLTLLLISTTPAKTIDAPTVPPWPANLPQAQRRDDGTYLPKPLDEEVLKRLLYLDRYPGLCQTTLDVRDKLCEARLQAASEEHGTSTWQWPTAIGILTGAAVGYYFGHH